MRHIRAILVVLGRLVLAVTFWGAVRLFFAVRVYSLQHAAVSQNCYFAMAHKRDVDPIIEIPFVLARRGWRALAGEVRFVLRGDAFWPGFLARLVQRPRWLTWLARPLNLGPLLHALGVRPLESLQLRPAEQWIRDWLRVGDDRPAGEVLVPSFLQRIAAQCGEDVQILRQQQLSHLLSWRYQRYLQRLYHADLFVEPVRRRVKQEVLRLLQQQLADLKAWMMHGGSAWGAPEGQLSSDGRLSPIPSILHRLLQDCPPDLCVVPISITYDFMTVRRPRVLISVAPPLENAPQLPARTLAWQLRSAWLLHTCFTCTHLASDFLARIQQQAMVSFTSGEMVADIEKQVRQLVYAGRLVDPRLLSRGKIQRLANGYLKFALRRGLVRRMGRRWSLVASGLVPGNMAGYKNDPLAYALNELQEMLSVTATTGPMMRLA